MRLCSAGGEGSGQRAGDASLLFFHSPFTCYIEDILYLFRSSQFFTMFYMITFFMTSIGFYGFGIYQFIRKV